jgi:hypothetical protein
MTRKATKATLHANRCNRATVIRTNQGINSSRRSLKRVHKKLNRIAFFRV